MKYASISIERGYAGAAIRFGTNSTRKINIGDYAQILAIDHLYEVMGIPAKDIIYIEYYDLFDYDGEYVILPINFIFFNAYYGERDLILSPKIIPVFLGIHAINGSYNERELEYFRRFSPIGCRDIRTLSIFRKKNIDAYLQGCITSTLPKRAPEKETYKKIYFVDTPDSLNSYIPPEIEPKVEHLSQEIYGEIDKWLQEEQCRTIKEYMGKRLSLYRDTAALVVTSRLHCAAPCVAMGIPTIFACEEYSSTYAWIEKLIPIYTPKTFKDINWNPSVIEYEPLKDSILKFAIHRLRTTYEKYHDRCQISDFFESNFSDDYKDAYTWRLAKYGEKHWKTTDKFKYIVWGVTQITDGVCEYIAQEYPNASLVGVIDDYREITYRGLRSIKSDKIIEYPDCYFIATGNSSSSAAQLKFAELGWNDKLCTVFGDNFLTRKEDK